MIAAQPGLVATYEPPATGGDTVALPVVAWSEQVYVALVRHPRHPHLVACHQLADTEWAGAFTGIIDTTETTS